MILVNQLTGSPWTAPMCNVQSFVILHPELTDSEVAVELASCLHEDVVVARRQFFREVEVFAWRKLDNLLLVKTDSIVSHCSILAELGTQPEIAQLIGAFESCYGDM